MKVEDLHILDLVVGESLDCLGTYYKIKRKFSDIHQHLEPDDEYRERIKERASIISEVYKHSDKIRIYHVKENNKMLTKTCLILAFCLLLSTFANYYYLLRLEGYLIK